MTSDKTKPKLVYATNYATIQEAIDEVTFPLGSPYSGEVFFHSGKYETDTALITGVDRTMPNWEKRLTDRRPGVWTGETKNRVVLRGQGHVEICYTGPKTDKYLFYATGKKHGFVAAENLVFRCYDNCRGVYAGHLAYQTGLQSIQIQRARQIALDLFDCWCSRFVDIQINSFKGVAVRTHHFNGSQLLNCTVKGGGVDWPDPKENTIVDAKGYAIRVSESKRSALCLHGNGPMITLLNLEACTGPLGIYADTPFATYQNTRFEGYALDRAGWIPEGADHQQWDGLTMYMRDKMKCTFHLGKDITNCKFERIQLTEKSSPVFEHEAGVLG